MIRTDLDRIIVAARRHGTLAGVKLRFSRTTEQIFFHYPDGGVDHIPVAFRGTKRCTDGTEYDEFGPSRAPKSGFDAVVHTHQDRATAGSRHFPFPGTRDGVTPRRHSVPNYGISSIGAWVVRPGALLSVELLDGAWGARFNPEAFARAINRGGGDAAVGTSVVCR